MTRGKTAATTELTRTYAMWKNRGHPCWSEHQTGEREAELPRNEADA